MSSQLSDKKDNWIEITCPVCTAKGYHGLLLKIKNCLAGDKYIEIKCKSCKEIVRVP